MSEQQIDSGGARGSQSKGRGSAEKTRQAVALVAGGLIAVFAVLNTGEVEVNWILGTAETPLILVIVICLVLGAAGGYVAGRRGSRSRKRG